MTKPMEGPSTPSDKVRGPQDLVMRMNVATSDDWEQIPLPARQQLGEHERLADAKSGNGVNDYFGKSAQDLVHAVEQSDRTDETKTLSRFVDYHLEATEPPAEPAGAPGTAGYNKLSRNVPAADGYDLDVEHTLTDAGSTRVLQFAPDQGLGENEQAKFDGAGPFVPAKALEPAESDDQYGTANGVKHGHSEAFAAKDDTKRPARRSKAAPAEAKSDAPKDAPAADTTGDKSH